VCGVEVIADGAEAEIYVIHECGQPMPLRLMGDGAIQMARILLHSASVRDGILLIDEIDSGLHYSVLEDMWRTVRESARRFNVQVFATTHSWECIEAAQSAFGDANPEEFLYHRLERAKDHVRVVTADPGQLATAVEQGWEIR
jgi:predicted ATPase